VDGRVWREERIAQVAGVTTAANTNAAAMALMMMVVVM
jgi:hypothetical protein